MVQKTAEKKKNELDSRSRFHGVVSDERDSKLIPTKSILATGEAFKPGVQCLDCAFQASWLSAMGEPGAEAETQRQREARELWNERALLIAGARASLSVVNRLYEEIREIEAKAARLLSEEGGAQ